MPIYEYLCRGCGSRNEFLEGVTQTQEEKVCEQCGGDDLNKLVSMTSFTIASTGTAACGGDDCACAQEQGGGPMCGCGGGGGCGHL